MKKHFFIYTFCSFLHISICLGQGWFQISSGTSSDMTGLFFMNSNTGFVAGDTYLRTTNGGVNWIQGTTGSSSTHIYGVTFANALTGIMVGWHTSFMFDVSVIWRTTNLGVNWNIVGSGFGWILLKSVTFPTDNIGFAAGYNEGHGVFPVLKTTDGGANWNALSGDATAYGWLSDVCFINDQTGYVAGGLSAGVIGKTTDGGLNWNTVYTGSSELKSVFFSNSNTGYACGTNGLMLKTTNAGSVWNLQQSLTSNRLNTLYFLNPDTGYCAGDLGVICITTNGGANWQIQNSGSAQFLTGISFSNSGTGYCVGDFGTIIKTTNGGASFAQQISSEIPARFLLHQNYPNPFNPKTVISYQLRVSSYVRLIVFDILGKEVNTLVNQKQGAGTYEVDFSAAGGGNNISSGIYFYSLYIDNDLIDTKKMVMLK